MLAIRLNPVGIDIPIQKAQTALFDRLTKKWGNVSYNCYGRCYRNQDKTRGYIAEVFSGGEDYKEIFFDDTLAASSFFGVGEKVQAKTMMIASVHLVFFVNLQKLGLKDKQGNLIQHRADEEARQNVMAAMGNNLFGMEWQGVELYTENVLREYQGTRTDKMKFIDMHPFHCFRLNYNLMYDPDKIC